MTGGYGLNLIPLHGGGLRFEVISGSDSAATDMNQEQAAEAVASILKCTGVVEAVFEDGVLRVMYR